MIITNSISSTMAKVFEVYPLFQKYNETIEYERELDCKEERYIFVNNSEYDLTKMQPDDLMHCLMGIGSIRFLEDGWRINILPA